MSEILVPFEARPAPAPTFAAESRPLYPARVARQLALAHALQGRLAAGDFADRADMARALGFTRARVSQLLDLLLLAPDIQEEILFLECPAGRQPISEHDIRPIAQSTLWSDQRRAWRALLLKTGTRPTLSGC
jgi:hypothetical protein